MKKTSISSLFLALVSVVYLFLSLITGILTEASAEFWAGFGCLTFGAAVAIAILLIFANRQTTIRDVFFNAPIYYIGFVYFAVTAVLSVLHMLVGFFTFKRLLILQLIAFAVFAVYFILALVSKTNAETVNENVAEKNAFIREMTAKLNTLSALCADREMKLKLESLAEEFRYSKPACLTALDEVEGLIRQKVAVLDYQIEKNDMESASETMADIGKALLSRNETAKRC